MTWIIILNVTLPKAFSPAWVSFNGLKPIYGSLDSSDSIFFTAVSYKYTPPVFRIPCTHAPPLPINKSTPAGDVMTASLTFDEN
jgi:hypothetical protein